MTRMWQRKIVKVLFSLVSEVCILPVKTMPNETVRSHGWPDFDQKHETLEEVKFCCDFSHRPVLH